MITSAGAMRTGRLITGLVLTLAAAFGVVSATAHASVVQTTNKKTSAGQADFGSGHHSFGSPEGMPRSPSTAAARA